ncbi:MAG: hypothetical protein GYA51_18675 [Candidatus Methanofastidiosa archaeon]|nr:hypothetical protein [Candidatus Methanofastidiosa archaeon]
MIDIFSLFKTIFTLLGIFGLELFFFFQGIKYYKTGEIVEGFRRQDVIFKELMWTTSESYDSSIAFGYPIMGIILFIAFNILFSWILIENLIIGLLFFSIHDLGLYLILRGYWKKKELEANQKGEAESE